MNQSYALPVLAFEDGARRLTEARSVLRAWLVRVRVAEDAAGRVDPVLLRLMEDRAVRDIATALGVDDLPANDV